MNNRHGFYIAFAILIPCIMTSTAYGSVQVNTTRVIFNGNGKDAIVTVKNTDKNTPNLIQSWVENNDSTENKNFIVVPPLFRLDANEESGLRIKLLSKNLPQDRESLFWFNVKSIAPTNMDIANKLQINFRTKIKLIYRPVGLSKNKDEIFESYKKIKVENSPNGLTLANPTPYYMNFSRVLVDGKDVQMPGFIPPFGKVHYDGYKGNNVTWQVINDYGGVSKPFPERK